MHEFRRMMQAVLKNKWAGQWITLCLVLVSAGLLFSRALLSFASVLMIVPFFAGIKKNSFQNRCLLPVLLIILPVLLSGLWSGDQQTWWNSVAIKAPLLTILLGVSSAKLSQKQWLLVAMAFVLFVSIGCSWSLYQYASNSAAIEASYLKAKVLPTLADHDYVRFSLMVVIALLIGLKCLPWLPSRSAQGLLLFLLGSLTIYLHILATKTGLICLYSCCFMYLLHLVFIQKKWKTGLWVLMMITIAATIAYKTLPTLRNRVQYVMYDYSLFSRSDTGRGYNDAARWLSIRAGYDLTGRTSSRHIRSVLLSVTAFIPMLTDDSLEGQFGVVLLSFIAFFGQQNLSQPVTRT
jgi:O-antigen ligase